MGADLGIIADSAGIQPRFLMKILSRNVKRFEVFRQKHLKKY